MVLANPEYLEMILSDTYTSRFHSMGTVDENNHPNIYDGMVRVVDPDGAEVVKYHPRDYLDHIAEHVEPWTYLKFPYLKVKGWHGFEDGPDSGIYRASPLSRLNAADGMATPLAQAEYERYFETLTGDSSGSVPVHQTLATHWARVVEVVHAAERTMELARDEEILSPEIRTIPTETPTEGIGSLEAPRGTLTHHYVTDERGILEQVNLDRWDHQQPRADQHVDQEGRPGTHHRGYGGHRGRAQQDRDGVPRLRPVFRVCHAQPAGSDVDDRSRASTGRNGALGDETQLKSDAGDATTPRS